MFMLLKINTLDVNHNSIDIYLVIKNRQNKNPAILITGFL